MKKAIELLTKAREKHKISLSEVADITKISLTTLQAMEDQNLKLLPPEPYLRGFVRSYAKCLNMDEKEVLTIFDEEMIATKHKPQKETETSTQSIFFSMVKCISKYMLGSNAFKVLSALATLVLVLVVIFAVWMFHKYSKESKIDIPLTTNTLTTESDNTSITSISTTTVTAATSVVVGNVRRIEIIALGALRVSYTVDNSATMTNDLQTGETIMVSGTNVEIRTDDVSSTSIVVDKRKLPISGNEGEPFVFKIP